ncbi:hypothetical protein [Yersinia ruckeri]|uniref:hypothetical protein n=1 Tax=Yersinia ruckeri TaxID=29486 RepID=UPI0020BDDF14|nr:hypothetical protein [Yersinia ruckeri]EKN4181319.1 hypothetical protein [Yersinia ruckeri]MCK8554007.1 hypothetical protein [Yersinia ruckeri]
MNDYNSEVYVNYGNLVSFPAGSNELYMQDVLNSCLLAQLASDKKMSRFSSPDYWLINYKKTLGSIFWHFTGSIFDTHKPADGAENMVIIKVIGDFFKQNAARCVYISAMNSMNLMLKKLRGDSALAVFHTGSYQETDAVDCILHSCPQNFTRVNVQVSAISETNIVTAFCLFFVTSESVTDKLLSQKFATNKIIGNIHSYAVTAELLAGNYATIRETVINKLQGKGKDYILPLSRNN